jgi:glycosyltransferase involved in cell wall biosynthesis
MKASAGNTGKILIIVENLPVPFDRRVWQEATTLKEAGYGVSVICPKSKAFPLKYECLDGIHIYRYPMPPEARGALGYAVEYPLALLWQFVLSWKVLFSRGFNVIHACNPPDNIFLIGLVFKLLGKKFVFDHHDICPELYLAKFEKKDFLYKIMLLSERLTYKSADVSIATNESYKQIAIQRGKMSPDKVFVVRSGPNLNRIVRMPPVEALKQGRKYLVGYVGVMGKQEGIEYLLRSIQHIVYNMGRKDIHFGLVGGGPELNHMKSYAEELRIADYVTFTGRVPDKDMLEVLNTADVCVNPDVANEMNDKSTMNKIMEYMAVGKPIVQFDLAEGRFSARDASLYAKKNDEIDFAEKIVELLNDPDRRENMGRQGRQRVENELQWTHEVPKLLAAYKTLFV